MHQLHSTEQRWFRHSQCCRLMAASGLVSDARFSVRSLTCHCVHSPAQRQPASTDHRPLNTVSLPSRWLWFVLAPILRNKKKVRRGCKKVETHIDRKPARQCNSAKC
jgi:hypothetical protein